jgi:preprotein translocase subunit YajC
VTTWMKLAIRDRILPDIDEDDEDIDEDEDDELDDTDLDDADHESRATKDS